MGSPSDIESSSGAARGGLVGSLLSHLDGPIGITRITLSIPSISDCDLMLGLFRGKGNGCVSDSFRGSGSFRGIGIESGICPSICIRIRICGSIAICWSVDFCLFLSIFRDLEAFRHRARTGRAAARRRSPLTATTTREEQHPTHRNRT